MEKGTSARDAVGATTGAAAEPERSRIPSRRGILQGAALLAAVPVGALASKVLAGADPVPGSFEVCTADGLVQADEPPALASVRTLKLAWNPNAVCISPVVVAQHKGFFGEQNLNVELIELRRLDRAAAGIDRDRQGRRRPRAWRCAG